MTIAELINNIWCNESTQELVICNPKLKRCVTWTGGIRLNEFPWSIVLRRYHALDEHRWYATCEINGDTLTYNWSGVSGEVYPLPDYKKKELLLKYCIL